MCVGSTGRGFLTHYEKCSQKKNTIYNNDIVGSSSIGFELEEGIGSCSLAHGLYAYACNVGVTGNPSTRNLHYQDLHIIDCATALTLKTYRTGLDINAFVENSYFSILERSNCDYCYGASATKCSNTKGIELFVAGYERSLDAKAFITNVAFSNYNYQDSTFTQCGQNYALRAPSSADEFIASHHLYNVTCPSCSGLAFFDEPRLDENGVPYGGKLNYFIEDHDGKFLGGNHSLVPSSPFTESLPNCQLHDIYNGYKC